MRVRASAPTAGCCVEIDGAARSTATLELEDRIGALDGALVVDGADRARGDPVRIVIADDEMLMREGLARLLGDAGFDVVGRASDGPELLRAVRLTEPDVAIVDIKMPPTHTEEGLVAAQEIRAEHPAVGVLVLSHYLESVYAMRLLQEHPERVGYLLKERVSDIAVLADALRRIAEGECVLDPTIVHAAAAPAARGERARRAHRPRARGAGADGRGPLQPRDLRAAGGEPEDGRDPHPPDLPEARAARARRTRTAACWRCSRSCARDAQASPASCASSAIWTRLLSSSLVSSRETWALTVATLM